MTSLQQAEYREKEAVLAMLNTVIELTEFAVTCGDPFCQSAAGLYRAQAGEELKRKLGEIEARYAVARAQEAANG